MRILLHIVLLFTSCVLLMDCGGDGEAGRRLREADALVDSAPDSAYSILATMRTDGLNKKQRALHALLTVKAADKSYLQHTSDSLINIAVGYFGDGNNDLLTAESHYYSGRVYSDIGNYPKALKSFHVALRILSHLKDNDSKVEALKAAVLSQYGYLLQVVRLYPEAIPFYKAAIKADSVLGDTLNLFYDLRDLAFAYIEQDMSDSARILLDRGLKIAGKEIPSELISSLHELYALNDLRDGKPEQAVEHLDWILQSCDSTDNSMNLSITARIYEQMGRMDSAVHYAKLLRAQPFSPNSFTAARILAKNSLRSGNRDTISAYHDSLAECAVRLLDLHSRKMNLTGHMFYRHMMTEIDNSQLKSRNQHLTIILLCVALTAAISILILLAILYRKTHRRQLEAETISNLQHIVLQQTTESAPTVSETGGEGPRDKLVRALLDRITELAERSSNSESPFRDSETVSHLLKMVGEGSSLSPTSEIWKRLESEILQVSPDFKSNIELLIGKPSVNDYHIALLIKVGMTPTQISILMGRAKGTISNNRQRMCERIFRQKLSNSQFDDLIRTL